MTKPQVKTPCIGICSTSSVGDAICRGCKRFAVEVINWNSYTVTEKQAVLLRVEKLAVPIMEARFIIRSRSMLETGLKGQGVPYNTSLSPYLWLHNLLKKRHRNLSDLSGYGVDVRANYAAVPLAQLVEEADQELLRLCEAHLQRYFPQPAL